MEFPRERAARRSRNMLRRSKKTWALVVTLLMLASLGLLGTAAAQKASVPRSQDKLAMGEDQVRQLLALMDADKNGKVSKEKYLRFMEAEFERLDNGQPICRKIEVRTMAQCPVARPVRRFCYCENRQNPRAHRSGLAARIPSCEYGQPQR